MRRGRGELRPPEVRLALHLRGEKVDAGGGADGHVAFHALASQREMQTIASGSLRRRRRKCSLDPRPAAARAGGVRGALLDETRKRGGLAVCVGAPASTATTFDATLKHAMIHHFFYGDADDESIRMHAARVINASAATWWTTRGPPRGSCSSPTWCPRPRE